MLRGLLGIMMVLATLPLAGGGAEAATLDNLRGSKRVVVLFAKSRGDAGLDKQLGLFTDLRAEVKDRELVVITVINGRSAIAAVGYASMPTGAGRRLYKEFAPEPSGLTGVLVGKDGAEKFRWHGVIDPYDIFDRIDAMPTGQEDLHNRAGG